MSGSAAERRKTVATAEGRGSGFRRHEPRSGDRIFRRSEGVNKWGLTPLAQQDVNVNNGLPLRGRGQTPFVHTFYAAVPLTRGTANQAEWHAHCCL